MAETTNTAPAVTQPEGFAVNDKGTIIATPDGWLASRGRAVAKDGSAYALVGPEGIVELFPVATISAPALAFFCSYGHGQKYGSDISLSKEKQAELGPEGVAALRTDVWTGLKGDLAQADLSAIMTRPASGRTAIIIPAWALTVAAQLSRTQAFVTKATEAGLLNKDGSIPKGQMTEAGFEDLVTKTIGAKAWNSKVRPFMEAEKARETELSGF